MKLLTPQLQKKVMTRKRKIVIRGSHFRDQSGVINFSPEPAKSFSECLPQARKLFQLFPRAQMIIIWFNDNPHTVLKAETKKMTLIRFHLLTHTTMGGKGYLIGGQMCVGESAVHRIYAMTKTEFARDWREHN